MSDFVRHGSIVREIWSDGDTILVIFAAAAAEFALNRAVDWLFVTRRLPSDPLARLFSTVSYAQRIALGGRVEAERAVSGIRAAHAAVERKRGARIPDWAYKDVLYMLVDGSERAFERLRRPLTASEREELYGVFRRLGEGLGMAGLPGSYGAWKIDRERHLQRDLVYSPYTQALYAAYRRQLGPWRYRLLLQLQAAVVHERVRALLDLPRLAWMGAASPFTVAPPGGTVCARWCAGRSFRPPISRPCARWIARRPDECRRTPSHRTASTPSLWGCAARVRLRMLKAPSSDVSSNGRSA